MTEILISSGLPLATTNGGLPIFLCRYRQNDSRGELCAIVHGMNGNTPKVGDTWEYILNDKVITNTIIKVTPLDSSMY